MTGILSSDSRLKNSLGRCETQTLLANRWRLYARTEA